MIKWIDSHCHIQLCENKEEIFENAQKKLDKFLCIGLTLNEYSEIQKFKSENGLISIGEHPLNETDCDEKLFEKILQEGKISAIGETGFDFQGDFEAQKKNFQIHAKMAEKYELPIVLHTRDADAVCISELTKYPNLKGVFHCFTGSLELAEFAIKQGWFISFSGIITFKNAEKLREILKIVPKELILIETDSPYLAPVPFRGKPNEPINVRYVGEFIADFLEISHVEFAEIIRKNFENFLNCNKKK